jgi:hypothetical protein
MSEFGCDFGWFMGTAGTEGRMVGIAGTDVARQRGDTRALIRGDGRLWGMKNQTIKVL